MAKAKGSEKTGGRKKGTLNKTSTAIKDAIVESFFSKEVGGMKYLKKLAKENQPEYNRLLAKCLPAEIKADLSGQLEIKVEVVKYTE